MKITDMNDNLFDREMQKLLADVQFWCVRLSAINGKFHLEPSPTSYLDGTGKQPFPLALELKRCWDYARGTGPRPEEMHEIIQSLCELLWSTIGGTGSAIPADWWDTPLGTMCRMCEARTALEYGETIDTYGLALLADLSHMRIRQLCQSGDIEAEKMPRETSSQEQWVIPAEEARRFLAGREG